MHVLLVYAIERIQTRFMEEVDQSVLPKLRRFEGEACQNIAEAKRLISQGGPRDQLQGNIEAAKTTIDACRLLSGIVTEQRTAIARENIHTRVLVAASRNTYRTVGLSLNVAEMMNGCRKAFEAVRCLTVPQIRPYQNAALRDEMQRLSERLLEKGA
jgi:hypothetical protein